MRVVWLVPLLLANVLAGADPVSVTVCDQLPREAVFDNAQLHVRYGSYESKDVGAKDAIVEMWRKPDDRNVANRVDSRSANGSKGRSNRLTGVKIIADCASYKTVQLNYGDGAAVEDVTLHGGASWLEIVYRHHDVNVFDIGSQTGTYEITGAPQWQSSRGWPATYPPYPDSYYRKEWGEATGLVHNGWYVMGVFDPATGAGFGRVMPNEDIDVVKLLFRKGFEMFPHYQPHRAQRPFPGYLFAVAKGRDEIEATGKQLAGRWTPQQALEAIEHRTCAAGH